MRRDPNPGTMTPGKWITDLVVAGLLGALVAAVVTYGIVGDRLRVCNAALAEYEDNEVLRQMDECERCKRNEVNNWMWAAHERLDQLAQCEYENALCESALEDTERFWHPAHITPHTDEACRGYACDCWWEGGRTWRTTGH